MRTTFVLALVALVGLPAAARPHKRPHRRAHAAPAHVQVVPNDRAAQEHARAEAELSDLRAGRVDDANAPPANEPPQVWAVQENDAEVPSNLRHK